MDREREYREKIIRPEEAFSMIRDGDCISVGGNLCEPQVFLAALGDHAEKMNGVEIVTGKQQTYSYQTKPGLRGRLDTIGHFFDAGQREGFRLGNVTHVPTNLHDYMKVVQESRRTNVFVAQVTPMDENGDFTLSGSNMWEGENLDHAETIILEVNPHIPRFRGCIRIPLHDVTALYEVDTPPVTIPRSVPSETDKAIAGYVAEHIHDGDCIQMGIGGMPDTVAGFLFDKHDLGLHTEMFTSACADLIEAGADVEMLNERLFESRSHARVIAERMALESLEFYYDDRCALICLTWDQIQAAGVAGAELEDLTSLPRSIEGVEVGLTLRQQKDGSFKISVRTGHNTLEPPQSVTTAPEKPQSLRRISCRRWAFSLA